ncbi:unnamed protein product [Lepeophtheirus salmonis]|uniref:(salmon louse) hypothetical protein n=1 Tax=Lepeophtheirus salmonis TaxID=72036 RepID=A0A7R8H275_LEPSM|nr:unnamed protein product [Lepeophtheirus salmonis]CAF2808822.1 unnamed protein product [Lepeophtheirus salmonis]
MGSLKAIHHHKIKDELDSVWKGAVFGDTTQKLAFILEADFIKREFDQSKIPDVLERYKNIQQTIRASIMGSKWILPEVKEEALYLMEQVDITLGYPNWATHSSLTDYFYKDLEELTNRELLDIMLWASLMKPNAFYHPLFNNIGVILPLMLKPYLQKRVPEYLSYGGIEISDAITYEKVNCIKEQFAEYSSKSNYSIQGGDFDSLMENMADTGGLQSSILLSNYFSFVLAQTFCAVSSTRRPVRSRDPHSLEKYRVLASVSTLRNFSQAFECAPESPMNRGEEGCDLL